jgi:hypothetical protein
MPGPLIPAAVAGLKGAGAAIKGWPLMTKLLAAYFGTTTALDFMESQAGMGVEKAKIGLGGKQMELAAAVGKREEARTDKLMRQLLGEKEKEHLRTEKTRTSKDIRASQERQNEMAMAMLMALSNFQGRQAETLSGPRPSTASMLSLMR